MSSQSLYLRWRPQTFSEVVGQDHVSRTLQNALREGRISHAYLFSGPRGTGKTSMARILAKAVNCLNEDVHARPDNTCDICRAVNEGRLIDLIEIDAASNTGVDDIRDLRDKVAFRPTIARYKIYIIDEVHMLSNSAFNALLKTLEEPPEHVIFVLATTEPHKIPATVLSRCQRFDFRRLSVSEIEGRLAQIAQEEGVQVEEGTLALIARSAGGGMRDAISLLDQLISYGGGRITREQVMELLGAVDEARIARLIGAVGGKEKGAALRILSEMVDGGVEPKRLASQIVSFLRDLLLFKSGGKALLDLPQESLSLLEPLAPKFDLEGLLLAVRKFEDAARAPGAAVYPSLPLELAALETIAALENPALVRSAPVEKPTVPPRAVAPSVGVTPPKRPAARAKERLAQAPRRTGDTWSDLLTLLGKYDRTVQAIMRSGSLVEMEGDRMVIGFRYRFHKEKMETEKAQRVLHRALEELFGRPVQAQVVMADRTAKPAGKKPPARPRPETKPADMREDPVVRAAVEKYGAQIVEEVKNGKA